jgi:hypothetical protein
VTIDLLSTRGLEFRFAIYVSVLTVTSSKAGRAVRREGSGPILSE